MSLEVRSGFFSYGKGNPVLQDVCMTAEDGQIISILGPNGVGKTTFVKCMLGFLKWNHGSTLIDGVDIHSIPSQSLWKKVAYVPQARAPIFSYTAEEMVVLGRSAYLGNFSVPGKKDLEIAHHAMELTGVVDLKDQPCNQMSGGQLQLVLIARALAAQPKYLILDEPESGLDFRNQIRVLNLIASLSHTQGITTVINTHFPEHALRISDQSLILFGNGMHLFGRTKQIVTEEHLRTAFGIEIAIRSEEIHGRSYDAVIPTELTEQEASHV